MTKSIAILGSTGSIGQSTLEVVSLNPGYFNIFLLTANTNFKELAKQVQKYKPKYVYLQDSNHHSEFKALIKESKTIFVDSTTSFYDLFSSNEFDTVISAVSGSAGLMSSYHAARNNKKILLANKESMVMAGSLIKKQYSDYKNYLFPIDSEHNSIFQIIGYKTDNIESITLTASGGPFIGKSKQFLQNITVDMALKHPNWVMGQKITIDSATMLNKALEVIEAFHLFELAKEKIKVIVHPESIIHSIVNFSDGASISQFSYPDMKIPISYVLGYPERLNSGVEPINLIQNKILNFYDIGDQFKQNVNLAYYSLEKPDFYPVILNAANEVAVNLFLNQKIKFNQIYDLIHNCLNRFAGIASYGEGSIDNILALHQESEDITYQLLSKTLN